MTPEERDQLIQRYYDGETLGAEADLARRVIEEDPEAAELLRSLQDISDSIRVDIARALEAEDFSAYWDRIAQRLPAEPATLDDEVVAASRSRTLERRSRPWLRWLFGAGVPAALAAALAVAVLPRPGGPALGPVSYDVEIVEVDSGGAMVVVQAATADSPAIVAFQESWES